MGDAGDTIQILSPWHSAFGFTLCMSRIYHRQLSPASRKKHIFLWILCPVLGTMFVIPMLTMNIRTMLNTLLTPALVSAVAIIIMFILRGVSTSLLRKWMKRTGTKLHDLVVGTLKVPSMYWCVAIGLYIGIEISELPRKYMFYVDKTIFIILIFSITLVVANLFVRIFENYIQRSNITVPATGIVFGVFKGTIIVAGMLIIFNVLGISITPLITALGVGGLAVALALKDTLSNLFAGLHMIASKEVRPGDYVKLDSGAEGTIKDITWRSTSISSPAQNIIIVPNAKVAEATITNFAVPNSEILFSLQVNAAYGGDLNKIEKVTLEVAKKIMNEIPEGVPGYEPTVRFNTFGDTGILFSVSLKAREWSAHYFVKHEFIKALHKRYAEESISFPVKTVG
jgi:small-conductance mechanosensitive channel